MSDFVSVPVDWEKTIEKHRREKDRFFAENHHSPLPPDQRTGFDGLDYFPPDQAFRFIRPLDEHETIETITIETTTDGERTYYRVGQFGFEVNGQACGLQAYKADPDESRLWIPFRDETSGTETYGAGRYLDLEADEHETESGTWVLDFNFAYNPFCVYSETYECPLVPMENWLEVRIEAGEKDYNPD